MAFHLSVTILQSVNRNGRNPLHILQVLHCDLLKTNIQTMKHPSIIFELKLEILCVGEYEYIDVMVENERLVIDIDFRSEFEIARSTGMYKTILQLIPNIFVGKTDRLGQIVSIVSEAARQSLKKKGMHFPPWRKAEYMRAKWLSPHIRSKPPNPSVKEIEITNMEENENNEESPTETDCGELELIFGDEETMITSGESNSIASSPPPQEGLYGGKKAALTVTPWQPPAIKPKSLDRGAKIVTGLASILKENP